ncbi:unannotated protein [freshwater metagenome]|uniref:Unannotated protein n=1 Tax=freshwater metagenome TaxID=449393 RepID=A0A6J6K7R3_9ZZZZ
MAELFAEDLDRNATGNDQRKLSINVDLRFAEVNRRFDAVDRLFDRTLLFVFEFFRIIDPAKFNFTFKTRSNIFCYCPESFEPHGHTNSFCDKIIRNITSTCQRKILEILG